MENRSAESAFRDLNDNDEITIETHYTGTQNSTVLEETQPDPDELDRMYQFGAAANCDILVFEGGQIKLKSIQNDGSLRASGRRVIHLVNHDKNYMFSTNEEPETGTTNIGE